MVNDNSHTQWDEELSRRYLDNGRYFVPERDQQMRIMIEMLRELPFSSVVLEICCGEGLLAEMLLERLPDSSYLGLDGSDLMLDSAKRRLARFEERVQLKSFNLAERSWRKPDQPVWAVVSSLGIHHLDEKGKQILFQDIYAMLMAGGAFIIADIVDPTTVAGRKIAAETWDEVVWQRSMELDGTTKGLDFFRQEGWNTYRYLDPQDIDHPNPLFDQLKWLEQADFIDIDVHFMKAGHAIFSGWKRS